MADQSDIEMRINGRAVFAAAAYLISLGVTFILERIGAPEALVRNLAPMVAIAALAMVGVAVRSSRLAAVLSADRAGSPIYAGAALAAIAAGLVVSLSNGPASNAPLDALVAGALIGALVIGPLARQTGASSLSDLLSARFSSRPLRLILAVAYFAIGAFIAAAGFETAVNAFSSLVGVSRETAIGVLAATLLFMIAPGGLAGLLWTAAAAAGVMLVVALTPIIAHLWSGGSLSEPLWRGGGDAAAALMRGWPQWGGAEPQGQGLDAVAAALGFAALPPFSTAAFASSSSLRAVRAGFVGLVLAALFALAFFAGGELWQGLGGPAAAGLRASSGLLIPLICAAAGVQTASRAFGVEAAGFGLESVLASRRLASARQLTILAVALCAFLSYRRDIDPSAALIAASSLSLALLAPALGLALSTRAAAVHAEAAIAVSLATIAGLAALQGWISAERHAPALALTGAAAGFVIGWATSLFGGRGKSSARHKLFVETPLEPGP